ncbi:hypothetical protein CKAH01_10525 [Colletotrichum kahawae]|uniref:Alkylmercury lyase n=1 Tax=Colletotrichum kahawae TaxID=34407 RepID=A0AAD9XX29_COLKA|nr:hypothetical protein CKAH01_10525 [Colletotrichum kahawae]
MDEVTRKVRYRIFEYYLENCRPPTTQDVAKSVGISEEQARVSFQQLDTAHHVVLHKHGVHTPTPICMAHPFSHLPTPYVVAQGARSWWTNCAWCGFGLAAMLLGPRGSSQSPVSLSAKSGTVDGEMNFIVTKHGIKLDGNGAETEKCVIHFSAPLKTWWTDVRFACGTIHVFGSQTQATEWCERYGFRYGEVMNLDTMWKLSKAWYENKASLDYDRFNAQEVTSLFQELGLVSEFWSR